jgi:hypothetical protein
MNCKAEVAALFLVVDDMLTMAMVPPLVRRRSSACKKGKEPRLQSCSWPSTERYNPDEMHACKRRTRQRLGPVGMNPSRLGISSDN